jgi:hyperpolarization activated cyclic nucleotide-gated potassium channel 2
VLNFNTGIFKKGSLVTNRRAIAKNYLKFWFWLDLVASVPYELIFALSFGVNDDGTDDSLYNAPKLLRLMRIFRFLRIVKLIRLAKLK